MFSGPQAGQFAAFPGHTIARKTSGRDPGRLSTDLQRNSQTGKDRQRFRTENLADCAKCLIFVLPKPLSGRRTEMCRAYGSKHG
jgi:hypothetical protein